MTGRVLIISALALYALVLGCVIWPSEAPGRDGGDAAGSPRDNGTMGVVGREGLPICAVGMQIQRTDWIERYKQSIDEIASLGAGAVKLVVDARQENGGSARIYLDLRMTPTPEQLGDLIAHAKSRNLRVILMPIVLLDRPRRTPEHDSEWRGKIAPLPDNGGWAEWWNSYRNMLGHFAWIAQANHVDVLVVGSELVSTEEQIEEWRRTVKSVRKVFKGRLTYSSNWDHYREVKFWDQLDLIGMNSYWGFGKEQSNPRPTVAQIEQRWADIQKDLLPFVRKTGRPLLFLEIGWFSQENVAYEPWDYTQGKPIDLEMQRRLYEGFFRSWWGKPELGGFSIWEWTPGDGGPEDDGYTPENKPAEQVLREWFAKPRWEVK